IEQREHQPGRSFERELSVEPRVPGLELRDQRIWRGMRRRGGMDPHLVEIRQAGNHDRDLYLLNFAFDGIDPHLHRSRSGPEWRAHLHDVEAARRRGLLPDEQALAAPMAESDPEGDGDAQHQAKSLHQENGVHYAAPPRSGFGSSSVPPSESCPDGSAARDNRPSSVWARDSCPASDPANESCPGEAPGRRDWISAIAWRAARTSSELRAALSATSSSGSTAAAEPPRPSAFAAATRRSACSRWRARIRDGSAAGLPVVPRAWGAATANSPFSRSTTLASTSMAAASPLLPSVSRQARAVWRRRPSKARVRMSLVRSNGSSRSRIDTAPALRVSSPSLSANSRRMPRPSAPSSWAAHSRTSGLGSAQEARSASRVIGSPGSSRTSKRRF